MKRTIWMIAAATIAATVSMLGQAPVADLVLTNGKIITVDDRFSIAQAVAVRGDRIVAVGTNQDINRLAGPNTRRIDLRGRDEEYRRIVGGFLSSDDYNLYVVYRDAANLYYDDPARYRAYIAEHELKGADTWRWASIDDLLRYRAQRKDSQRAAQRANTTVALAVANRFLSALHAARLAGRTSAEPRSWNFEVVPAGDGEDLALRCGVRTRF